jgi:hypothetical protein
MYKNNNMGFNLPSQDFLKILTYSNLYDTYKMGRAGFEPAKA